MTLPLFVQVLELIEATYIDLKQGPFTKVAFA